NTLQKDGEPKADTKHTENNNKEENNKTENNSQKDIVQKQEKQELKLQILTSDLEDGTADSQIYRALEGLLKAKPNIGKNGAFSFEIIGPAFDQNDDVVFLIAGINKLSHTIKGLSLN